SIFVPPLKAEHGLLTAQTQLVFGFTIATFALVMILAGKTAKKQGPRISAIIGAVLFTLGYLLASFSGGKVSLLLVGVGILSGAGITFGYVTSLTTPIKWFPDYKGLITGISVAGFGGGAILLSWIVKAMLENGKPVLQIFRIVGISYGIVVFLSALLFSVPEKTQTVSAGASQSVVKLLRDSKIWALFLAMFSGTFAGLLVIGNLKPIGLNFGVSETYATTAISFIEDSLWDWLLEIWRVLWGFVSDKLGGRRSVLLALILLTLFTLLIIPGSQSDLTFLFIPFLVGLGFGANFVLFATEVSQLYGVDKLGTIYPYVFLSYGFAGIIGPSMGGWLFDITQSYTTPIILSAIICAGGALLFHFMVPHKEVK
ncbi:MAG: MFS transporter, partial [Candidatus Marinimicrobia bacterium]|nr:MFS transporter [Candidatus Neomarinimicrobiota bacterium]